MPQQEEDYNPFASNFRRRASNLFPTYGESPESNFDTSGINRRAFGVQPFGSSYYPQQQEDTDYESSYTPSSTLKRYLNLSTSAPKREDYEPSGWGRGLAAAAGALEGYKGGAARGITAANAVRDMPYSRAMDDYETEYSTAASALKAEQQESQLKSMSDYRGGQLSEKAKDRIRKEAYDEGRLSQGQQKITNQAGQFDRGLLFKTREMEGEEKLKAEENRLQGEYNRGRLSLGELNRQLEAARVNISRGMLDVAQDNAVSNRMRAENAGDDNDTAGVNPTILKNAMDVAQEEAWNHAGPDDKAFFDPKTGRARPPGNWMFGLLPKDRTRYDQIISGIERRTQELVTGSRKTRNPNETNSMPNTPMRSGGSRAPVVNPNVTPREEPVKKTNW